MAPNVSRGESNHRAGESSAISRRSGLLHRTCGSSVEPVSVLGVDGYPYGFNITIEGGKPLVLFAYATRDRAEEATAQVRSAIEQAVAVNPHAQ
jgi:hypothetical protein